MDASNLSNDNLAIKKRDFRKRKFRTSNKFTGNRRKRVIPKEKKVKLNVSANNADEIQPNVNLNKDAEPNVNVNKDVFVVNNAETFIPLEDDFVSASKRKILSWEKEPAVGNVSENCVIVPVLALNELVSKSLCPECHQPGLTVREIEKKKKGIVSCLELVCTNDDCCAIVNNIYTSSKVKKKEPDTISNVVSPSTSFEKGRVGGGSSQLPFLSNLKLVLAMRAVGIGFTQTWRFLSILGLPKPMHIKSFQNLQNKLYEATMKAVKQNLTEVKNKIKIFYEEMQNEEGYKEGEISAMFDGTWQKRGHRSHNGVGTVIELFTGYVIDFEVMSNFCQVCEQGPKEDNENYDEWYEAHKLKCMKNVECSSHAMETEAAKKIWQRSASDESKLKITTFLSDGDSKAYNAVKELKPYGPEIDIIKEDCVNHISKRFGTGARKVDKELPRGFKLSNEWIRKLTLYFLLAIKINKGNLNMYKAILASLLHSSSNDTNHNHSLCPKDDWCSYNKAITRGEPPPKHKPGLKKEQADALKPLYKRLSDIQLLKQCLKGQTQNPVESFNNIVWTLCPKSRFANQKSVATAVGLAVLIFNRGAHGLSDVLKELNIIPSKHFEKCCKNADKLRIEQAQKKLTADAKYTRLKKKAALARHHDELEEMEGITYHPGGQALGMFDSM